MNIKNKLLCVAIFNMVLSTSYAGPCQTCPSGYISTADGKFCVTQLKKGGSSTLVPIHCPK